MVRRLITQAIFLFLSANLAYAGPAECALDMKRLCPRVSLGDPGTESCLLRNKSKLSIKCKVFTKRFGKIVHRVNKYCLSDVEQLCEDQRGGVSILSCLRDGKSELASSCRRELANLDKALLDR